MHQSAFARSLSGPVFALTLAASALAMTSSYASAQEKLARWYDDLDRGTQAARMSGKPLLVVFRCVR